MGGYIHAAGAVLLAAAKRFLKAFVGQKTNAKCGGGQQDNDNKIHIFSYAQIT